MKPYVDILGSRYKIEVRKKNEDQYMKDNHIDGYCCDSLKLIVVADMKDLFPDATAEEHEVFTKEVLRHEIIHAFYNESGLKDCSLSYPDGWARNEEMVDWIAIQFPKILDAYRWCDCI